MTRKQRDLLTFIKAYMAEHDGVAPSLAEMASALNLSSISNVQRMVKLLERDNLIMRLPHRARAIEIMTGGSSEYARGKRDGYTEGYRAAISELGRQMTERAA